MKSKIILISAGEASGDQHGAELIKSIKALRNDISFVGLGGGCMGACGARLFGDIDKLAVMGFSEVFSSLQYIRKCLKVMVRAMDNYRPDLLIVIDYPEFNMRLVKAAKKRKIPVLYYITPQVWAWRRYRIRLLSKKVDHLAVIFPFEEEIFRKKGGKATFIGHPLIDDFNKKGFNPKGFREDNNIEQSRELIALLPGSRKSELGLLLPPLLGAAKKILSQYPDMEFVLPVASTLNFDEVLKTVEMTGLPVKVIRTENIYSLLGACRAAIMASGTVTVQAALSGVPGVIIYKTSNLTYFLGRFLIRIKNIGMANLLAQETLYPELIQKQATADNIAEATMEILSDTKRRQKVIKGLSVVKKRLGQGGTSEKGAQIAVSLL